MLMLISQYMLFLQIFEIYMQVSEIIQIFT